MDAIARRTRLAFLNAEAALEALPRVIDLMARELKWDSKRQELEWKESMEFLATMGLSENLLRLSRQDVENGMVRDLDISQYKTFARIGEYWLKKAANTYYLFLLTGFADEPADMLQADASMKTTPG